MAVWLGMRTGAPIGGSVLRAHAILDDQTQLAACERGTSQGWAAAGPAPSQVTDLGQVTCGACLAALTRIGLPPSS